MALQLLKRNYTMDNASYEQPKILKLPQGEERWAPRRLPVDIGDVMMNMRMNDAKNRYVGEHVSKYAQGLNPYGEFGQPYKVNKNNIRPPIIDPKFYQPLSRMPVKFDSVTAGPIVKNLYEKKIEICKVAPRTITDKVCPDHAPRPSCKRRNATNSFHEGNIELHLKQPRASIPYHPSMPVYQNTGVPQIELQGKLFVRPQMGIHGPFHHSDQSRDVFNMRTPSHVAVRPGYKDPYTSLHMTPEQVLSGIDDASQTVSVATGYEPIFKQDGNMNTEYDFSPALQVAAMSNLADPTPTVSNLTRDGIDLTPKVQTSAWYNPSYKNMNIACSASTDNVNESHLTNRIQPGAQSMPTAQLLSEADLHANARQSVKYATPMNLAATTPINLKLTQHQGSDVPIHIQQVLPASRQTNISHRLLRDGELGEYALPDALNAGEFSGKASIPHIQEHPEYTRARSGGGSGNHEYFFVPSQSPASLFGDHQIGDRQSGDGDNPNNMKRSGIRTRLALQDSRVDRTGLDNTSRVNSVGTGRFIKNPF